MEAAEIDGAGWWQRLWRISVPLVSPVIFYNLILSVVGLLKYFLVPWVLNESVGRAQEESKFFMIYFYKQAFTFANMGYGATLAWILFIVALLITLALFATARYWVYYAGERES
jgi:multiple sugar transport system permease protein